MWTGQALNQTLPTASEIGGAACRIRSFDKRVPFLLIRRGLRQKLGNQHVPRTAKEFGLSKIPWWKYLVKKAKFEFHH
jgi:hypothetical protein